MDVFAAVYTDVFTTVPETPTQPVKRGQNAETASSGLKKYTVIDPPNRPIRALRVLPFAL